MPAYIPPPIYSTPSLVHKGGVTLPNFKNSKYNSGAPSPSPSLSCVPAATLHTLLPYASHLGSEGGVTPLNFLSTFIIAQNTSKHLASLFAVEECSDA